jgi:hypothetical protein
MNDISYQKFDPELNKYLEELHKEFMKNCRSNINNLEDLTICFEEFNKSETGKNLRNSFTSLQFSSDNLFFGLTPYKISPENLWALTGFPINLMPNFENKMIFKSIKIDEYTQSKLISNDLFDLIIIDPPFGNISRYQVTPEEAKSIFKQSIRISQELISKTGTILIRIPQEWHEVFSFPNEWGNPDKISNDIIILKFSLENAI